MKSKRILYFGIDPSRYHSIDKVEHLPLIRTRPLPYEWVKFFFAVPHSHVLFTSRTAITYYFQYREIKDKFFLCLGEATAARLADFGVRADRVAKEECAEGVVALLKQLTCEHILYPHSARARCLLPNYLKGKGTAFVLYDTYPTAVRLPDLTRFDKLVFTSPSTVEAFCSLCSVLPPREMCEAIGPITQNALNKIFESSMLQRSIERSSLTLKYEENNGQKIHPSRSSL